VKGSDRCAGWEPGAIVQQAGTLYRLLNEGVYVATPTSGLWYFRAERLDTGQETVIVPCVGDKILKRYKTE